ncbi:MAG: alpha/beta fold hydrolase [Candidatus Saccharimonadales bacterium]
MQIVVDHLLIKYERKGKGKKILLVHGWGVDLRSLGGLFKELSKDFDVVAIDLPGFGGSQTPTGVWGLSEYSSFLASFISKLGINNLYAVLGHSNGGAIAIKAVAGGYLEVQKLVLIASAGIRGTQKGKYTAIKIATKAAKLMSTPLPHATKNKLKQKLYKTIKSDYLVADNMTDSFKKIVQQDLRKDAKTINVATLIIYGSDDDQTPTMFGRTFHELIEGSTLEIIGGAGHFVQQDKPQIVVKLVRDFLC